MSEKFYTILTAQGKAKIANCNALGIKVNFSKFKVGDGNGNYYNPTEDMTELRNIVYEGSISSINIDADNPSWVVIQFIIPGETGGFTIREAGIYDDEGLLLAVGKYPETYKPVISDGSMKDLAIKMILEISNASSVTMKVDPTAILATQKDINNLKQYVDNQDYKSLSMIKTKKNIVISATNWIDDTAISGFYKYDIEDEDITENTVVDVNIHLEDLNKSKRIQSANISSTGKVTLFATLNPNNDITCDIKLVKAALI